MYLLMSLFASELGNMKHAHRGGPASYPLTQRTNQLSNGLAQGLRIRPFHTMFIGERVSDRKKTGCDEGVRRLIFIKDALYRFVGQGERPCWSSIMLSLIVLKDCCGGSAIRR
jgi:hypothetical protein